MEKDKGNPVPSLEKEVDDIILELDNAQYYGATPDLCIRASNLIYKLFKQNGVETNKEQPKCTCSESEAIYCGDGGPGKCQSQFAKDWHSSNVIG